MTETLRRIEMFDTHVSPSAIDKVNEVLRSGWLNEGETVKAFEARLAADLGLRRPVALNSGTAALHLALVLAGVEPGDEVALPAQTFVATGLVVLMQRARPVFVDIDPTTGNMCPDSLARSVTRRTKAVMPVHWGGSPCDLDRISAVAEEHGLVVVEDAAHALGARHRDRPIGAISRFTAFSFQSIKHLTTGDGGALCCLAEEDAAAAVRGRWFGIDRAAIRPSPIGDRGAIIETLGFKYHMNNVAAAIGLGNLDDFPRRLARRRHNARRYRNALAGVAGLELLGDPPEGWEPACWLFTILVDRRDDFVAALAGKGIRASVVDLSIDRHPVFADSRRDLPGQSEFDRRQISIPVHDALSDEDVERVIEAIRQGW